MEIIQTFLRYPNKGKHSLSPFYIDLCKALHKSVYAGNISRILMRLHCREDPTFCLKLSFQIQF